MFPLCAHSVRFRRERTNFTYVPEGPQDFDNRDDDVDQLENTYRSDALSRRGLVVSPSGHTRDAVDSYRSCERGSCRLKYKSYVQKRRAVGDRCTSARLMS